MSDPPRPTPFCGRDRELAELSEVWRQVRAGHGPRIAVVLAEAGLGKTRLAQEFFRWLAAEESGGGPSYWPAELGEQGQQQLRVNPPEADWNTEAAMPFLWWGLRLVNPLEERAPTGVLAGYVERDLLPHLEPFHREQRQRARREQMTRIGATAVVDVVADLIPGLGLIKKVGEVGMELAQVRREGLLDTGSSAGDLVQQRRSSLVDRLIKDLELLFQGPAGRSVPAVILLDDAQFSVTDPGVVAFIQALLPAMHAGQWPLLLLVTHWEQEWTTQVANKEPSVATTLAKELAADPDSTLLQRLGPVPDLSPLLDAGLPGLSEPQRHALLERAAGHPRFLDEIVRLAQGNRGRGFFEGLDQSRALTDRGLRQLLALSTKLHEVIANRLADSPEEVQKAVVLASVQGEEFLTRLVAETAEAMHESRDPIARAIDLADRPHAYVSDLHDGRVAFSQRIYLEVARSHLPNWFDEEEVKEGLAQILQRWLSDPGSRPQLEGEPWLATLRLASELLKDREDAGHRRVAAFASHLLLAYARHDGDLHTALAWARRLAEVLETIEDGDLDGDLQWLHEPIKALREAEDYDTQAPLLARLLRLTAETLAEEPDLPFAAPMHAKALLELGDQRWGLGDRVGAEQAFERAWEVIAARGHVGEERTSFDDEAAAAAAEVLNRLGMHWLHQARPDEAERALKGSMELHASLMREDDSLERRLAVLRAKGHLGSLAVQRSDRAMARSLRTDVVDGLRELLHEHGSFELEVAFCEALIALSLVIESWEDKVPPLMEALPILRAHAVADTTERRNLLATLLRHLANCARELKELDYAKEFAEEAVVLTRRSLAMVPSADHHGYLTMALTSALQAAQEAGDRDHARALAPEVLEHARALMAEAPSVFDRRTMIDAVCATAYFAGDLPDMLRALEEADRVYAEAPADARPYLAYAMVHLELKRAPLHRMLGDEAAEAAAMQRVREYGAIGHIRFVGDEVG